MDTMHPEDLFFRFWHSDGVVGPNTCPMKSTPHYQTAIEFLQGNLSGHGFMRYTAYISWAGQWDPSHSPAIYSQCLAKWKQEGFDLSQHPVAVFLRNEITYIVDGAHRCAFALALNYEQIPVVVAPEPVNWNWSKNLKRVESIESVVSPNTMVSLR